MHQYRFRERLEHGTPGRPWRLYSLRGSNGLVFPCHWHPEWEFLLVERGNLDLTWNQDTVTLRPGDAAFLTGTDLHGGVSRDPELLVHALVVHPALMHSEHRDAATERWVAPLEAGTLKVNGILAAGTRAANLVARLVEAVREDGDGVELELKGLVYLVLHDAVSRGGARPCQEAPSTDPLPRIRAALQYIEENFAEPLSVEILAQRAYLSPSHFTRVFKAVTGDSPFNHLIRRRLEEAARLLRDDGPSVSQIALSVGFSNFSHFSRTFRQHWGHSPSAFRGDFRPSQPTRVGNGVSEDAR